MGKRYRTMEDQKPWPSVALNQEFSRGIGKPKLKISKLGDECNQTSVGLTHTYHRQDLGAKPCL